MQVVVIEVISSCVLHDVIDNNPFPLSAANLFFSSACQSLDLLGNLIVFSLHRISASERFRSIDGKFLLKKLCGDVCGKQFPCLVSLKLNQLLRQVETRLNHLDSSRLRGNQVANQLTPVAENSVIFCVR